MNKLIAFDFGTYLYYELSKPIVPVEYCIDSNVFIVNSCSQIKNSKLDINHENMSRVMADNTELFVYIEDSVPLGMMLGHRGSCYIRGPGISLREGDDTIYWFWINTVPEARGKNVFKKLRNLFFTHYRDVKKIIALVDINNTIMKNEMHKMGFENTRKYSYIKFLCVSILFIKLNETGKVNIEISIGNKYDLLVI